MRGKSYDIDSVYTKLQENAMKSNATKIFNIRRYRTKDGAIELGFELFRQYAVQTS